SGTPAAGDSFTVKASTDQDMFTTLHGLITALRTPTGSGDAAAAAYQNAHDHVLTVRSQVGSRLNEIDTAQSTSEDLSLTYSQNLSRLQDLDYAQALSEFSLRQTYFEAAQKSFL